MSILLVNIQQSCMFKSWIQSIAPVTQGEMWVWNFQWVFFLCALRRLHHWTHHQPLPWGHGSAEEGKCTIFCEWHQRQNFTWILMESELCQMWDIIKKMPYNCKILPADWLTDLWHVALRQTPQIPNPVKITGIFVPESQDWLVLIYNSFNSQKLGIYYWLWF